VPPEQFEPQDDEPGTPDHHVERFEGLLLAGRESGDPFDHEFEVGLDGTEIDVLGIPARRRGMVIVWHGIDRARS